MRNEILDMRFQKTYSGIKTEGLQFYKLLFESESFTSELGKVALASSKLEAELSIFLIRNGVKINSKKATLGKLINLVEENYLLNKNQLISLKMVSVQRNYITHNLYPLFNNLIDETILEKETLLDSDVYTYEEIA